MLFPIRRLCDDTKCRTSTGMSSGAVPERRREDREDLQPVKQIAAKLLFRNHLGEIAIGRRDQANVHINRPCTA